MHVGGFRMQFGTFGSIFVVIRCILIDFDDNSTPLHILRVNQHPGAPLAVLAQIWERFSVCNR